MEELVKNLGLSTEEENSVLVEIERWNQNGKIFFKEKNPIRLHILGKYLLSVKKLPLEGEKSMLFLAHLAKGLVSYCHHLASVLVVNNYTKLFSSETT